MIERKSWAGAIVPKIGSNLLRGILAIISDCLLKMAPPSCHLHRKESTIIRGNVVEEITKLKQQPGKDMILDGSATLVQSLMGTDLIDEYRFLVVPYIMGRGGRFFPKWATIAHALLYYGEIS